MKAGLTSLCLLIAFFSFGQDLTTIKVTVPNKTDEVYVAGNQESRGSWQPDKVLMRKVSDFEREVTLVLSYPAEFKFTRGNWESEGITGEFYSNENCAIRDSSLAKVSFQIKYWKDDLQSSYYKYPFEIKKIKSPRIFEEERTVTIKLPHNYDKTKKYSVIYVLDGQSLFEPTLQSIQLLSQGTDNIPEVILVRVFHNNRGYETIPNLGYNSNRPEDEFLEGPLKLKEFLFEELVPFINSEYSTTGFSGIIGHSNTGHFVCNLAFQDKNPFNGIVALSVNSESKFFNERITLFLEQNQNLQVYLGYGKMDNGFKELAIDIENKATAQKWNYESLKVEGFQARHHQLPGLAILSGLKFLFRDYKNIEDFKSKIAEESQTVEEYLNNYSSKQVKFGVLEKVDESLIFDLLELTVESNNQKAFRELVAYIQKREDLEIQKNFIVYCAKELKDTAIADEYIAKVMESKDEMDYNLSYHNLETTYLDYFLKVKQSPTEAQRFTEAFINKSEKYTLVFSFYYAKIGIENGLNIAKSRKRLRYCKKNFKENPFFSETDLENLESL